MLHDFFSSASEEFLSLFLITHPLLHLFPLLVPLLPFTGFMTLLRTLFSLLYTVEMGKVGESWREEWTEDNSSSLLGTFR